MLSLDANVIVVFLIVWILVFLLSKLFFGPVRRVMRSREEGIEKNKNAQKKATEVYEKSLQDIEQAIKGARAFAESSREQLKAEAMKERARLLAELNAECRRQVEKARADLEKKKDEMKKKLAAEASVLAERIEKKLLD